MPSNNTFAEPTPRIETLSDMIFGLALSIAAFALIDMPPTDLNEILGDIVLFGFNFLVLISVWLRYSAIMSVLPVETRLAMLLNVALLFLVGIEPYTFNLVSLIGSFSSSQLDEYASVVYALDMAGLMLLLASFSHVLSTGKKLVTPPRALRYHKVRNVLFLSAVLFLITLLPQFWEMRVNGAPIRFYLWAIPLGISFTRRGYSLPGEKAYSRRRR
ncbi:MAG: TMEM175 family protein [Promethearchaeati archaeon SRVP18_Atabeyarchaeia-1]